MWPDQAGTERLLSQAQEGRQEAIEELLTVHREPLRRMVSMRLDPALAARVDASDIVQEVLLEAHRRLADYLRQGGGMPFHLWLRHLARDHVIDAYRRHRQAQRRSLDREQPLAPAVLDNQSSYELAGQLVDPELTPASAAARDELQARMQQAISTLDEVDREIILMRHGEQLSNQEIAQALQLTEAAASMRYLRAIRRLRAQLLPDEKKS